HDCKLCIEAVIQGVVSQIRRELEEPGSDSSRCRLRVLDMMGVPYLLISGVGFWSCTEAWATACVELSRHQEELQRHQRKRRNGCSGTTTA
ncbi:LRC14 protein, partial [Catharus fuscescens]|nr:LRC14 protein [Catharus fuscescens]